MKNILLFSAFIFFIACSNDDNSTAPEPDTEGQLTYVINGESMTFSAENVTACLGTNNVCGDGSESLLFLAADVPGAQYFRIIVRNVESDTTFNLNSNSFCAGSTASYQESIDVELEEIYRSYDNIGGSGQIEFSNVVVANGFVTATFEATLVQDNDSGNTLVITEGFFDTIPINNERCLQGGPFLIN